MKSPPALDMSRLVNLTENPAGSFVAQCPICAKDGGDPGSKNLHITQKNGRRSFGCDRHAGISEIDKEHKKQLGEFLFPPPEKHKKTEMVQPHGNGTKPQLAKEHITTAANCQDKTRWYNQSKKEYLLKNAQSEWYSITEVQVKMRLKEAGLRFKSIPGENLNPLERELLRIQHEDSVNFAISIAGYPQGRYDYQGIRFLIPKGPRLIQPIKGDWSTIRQFLTGLLEPEHETESQLVYLYGWLQVAINSLYGQPPFRQGQALVFAGQRNCGKTLVQKHIITPIFGGRDGKPYQYMTGKTPFNSDFIEAEHLIVDDEAASTDIRSRREFGANIKQVAASPSHRCHGKHKEAFMCAPFWRLTISVNDEPEHLLVLPPLEESLEDKIIILRCHGNAIPMPTQTEAQRSTFANAIKNELPAFIHFLTNDFKIEPDFASDRYGITHFHHPEIVNALGELSPERRLLSIIESNIINAFPFQWSGKAEELTRRLCDPNCADYNEARKSFCTPRLVGAYLGRLKKSFPDMVSSKNHSGSILWTIRVPN